jgi:uncharacterized protein YkwD
MCSPGAADACEVSCAHLRSRSVLALPIICLCALAGAATARAGVSLASTTPTARATSAHHRGRAHRRRAKTAVRCAKKSSFHARGGHIHRRHHPAGCAPHGSTKHRAATHKADHAKRHRSGAGNPAHAGDSCPGADLQPTEEDIEVVRTATLCLVNQERTSRGEAPLQQNAHLQQSAQSHTESMADDDYFEHDGPNGDTPLSRMIAAGYNPSGGNVGYEIGENIGWGTLSLGTPRAIVAAWMASPGHRANILDAHFRDTAVGISPHVPSSLSGGQTGGIYTQDFGVIITG